MTRSLVTVLTHKAANAGRFLVLGAAMLSLAGCAVGPKYKTPPIPAPPAYKEIGD